MKCSQCQKSYPEEQCFWNVKAKEIWCMNCMAKEKKKRDYIDKVKGELYKPSKKKKKR